MTKQEVKPNSQKKLFFGLFVFPLLIAVGMAVLLATIVFLTKEDETPESLIKAIKTGAPSKRWQKAFELSNELNHQEGLIRSSGIMNEITRIVNDGDHYDTKTRSYMAMALSRYRNDDARHSLEAVLAKLDLDDETELPIFVMWAVGSYEHPESAREVARFLKSTHADVRKTAAYILGAFGQCQTAGKNGCWFKKDLQTALEDSADDVKWNSALSLARLSNDSGWKVLAQMLDRQYLKSIRQLNDLEIEPIMINAAKGFALIRKPEIISLLEQVSRNDASLKVRQAALSALEFQKNPL